MSIFPDPRDLVHQHHAAPLAPAPPDSRPDLRPDPRTLTPARIGLERSGISLATRHVLEMAAAQALARDAVHAPLSVSALLAGLRERRLPALAVQSSAPSRATYLRRPDLGRSLSLQSAELLAAAAQPATQPAQTATAAVTIVLADGLSAFAVERHALPLLDLLLPLLGLPSHPQDSAAPWTLTPIVLAEQARVALGDAVAQALRAHLVVVLIGERPGLSAPDSLGAYVTWRPAVGTTDAARNCVSNIRTLGLPYAEAAARIAFYCIQGRRAGATGVELLARHNAALPAPAAPPSRG